MRTLKAKDIFKKTYSIVNGEVIKNTNGEYYSKQVAEYVLKNSKILNNLELKKIMKLDEDQLNNYAIKYFRNKYSSKTKVKIFYTYLIRNLKYLR